MTVFVHFRQQSKIMPRSSTGGNFVSPPTPDSDTSHQMLDVKPSVSVPSISTPSTEEPGRDLSIQSEITSGKGCSSHAPLIIVVYNCRTKATHTGCIAGCHL